MPNLSQLPKRKLQIILDSNALLVPLEFKIDIFEELENVVNTAMKPILLSPILDEIEKIARESSPKMRKNATYALKLAERCEIVRIDEADMPADDAIVKVANERKCPVFTNDRALRKRLRNINVPVIYLRQKSRLEIDGRI